MSYDSNKVTSIVYVPCYILLTGKVYSKLAEKVAKRGSIKFFLITLWGGKLMRVINEVV